MKTAKSTDNERPITANILHVVSCVVVSAHHAIGRNALVAMHEECKRAHVHQCEKSRHNGDILATQKTKHNTSGDQGSSIPTP
jgi:hypothetical protein